MGWAKVKISISLGNKKRNAGKEGKEQKIMGLRQSKNLDFNSKLVEKRWMWAEVKIWNPMMLCMKRGRKIMGLGRSKDLDFNSKLAEKKMNVSWSKDLKLYDVMYEKTKKNYGVRMK